MPERGPALIYLAEDALPVVRERVAGMARHRGLDLAGLEIHVITAPSLRLDRQPHRQRLLETAKRLRPRLLLLDPLARLQAVDENNAGEIAELLAYYRSLQRQLDLSVILVHHTRKNAPGGVAAGQGLRGSSDLHAFGDSNLYLRRAAPAAPTVYLELVTTPPDTPHLRVAGELQEQNRRNLQDQVLDLLAREGTLTRTKVRDALSVKNERLGEALQALQQAGRIQATPGWLATQ